MILELFCFREPWSITSQRPYCSTINFIYNGRWVYHIYLNTLFDFINKVLLKTTRIHELKFKNKALTWKDRLTFFQKILLSMFMNFILFTDF